MSISINGSTGISGVVGTASTPALIGTDADTGLYFPTANEVALATAGSQRLLIDSSGNIVIGGTLTSGSFIPTSSTVPTNGIYLSAANTVAVATNGAGRLYVDASGNVGHKSTPASWDPDSGLSAIQLNGYGAIWNYYNNVQLAFNTYQSSTGDKYLTTDEAAKYTLDSSGNHVWYTASSGSANAAVTFSERLRITSAGLMGLGTSSPTTPLSVRTVSNIPTYGNVSANFSDNTTGTLYISHSSGVQGLISDGTLAFGSGASGTERARIDTSGRLLVGTSSTSKDFSAVFQGNSADATGGANLLLARGTSSPADGSAIGYLSFTDSNHNTTAQIQAQRDGGTWTSGTSQPGRLVFSTTYDGASSPTERMRILATGFVKAKNDGGTFPTGAIHEFSSDENIYVAFRVENQNNLSGSGTYNSLLGTNCNNTSSYHFVGNTGASDKIYIYGNGNIVNSNNSYGLMSDVKLKENIVDANSQWNDLKTLRVVNFNFKEETGYQTHTQIGFIAQEVEQVSPGLVYETPDLDIEGNNLGTVTKVLQSSVLYTKAVKALQEAMERIETLEAQNSDFATRLTALESA